jgi:hypothetical protein
LQLGVQLPKGVLSGCLLVDEKDHRLLSVSIENAVPRTVLHRKILVLFLKHALQWL